MVQRDGSIASRDNDTISEMSANQGTLSTAGTGNSDHKNKEHRKAHELRLNLIYSGFYMVGTAFLCIYDISHFLFYPAFIFLIAHAIMELRHDMVHKSRYFAHARYTQASPNDRSYGGDLYMANLAQSCFFFLGTTLFLLAIILRVREASFGLYKATYFASSVFFFSSGATTIVSRGCGSLYFLGRAPGFSIRDQTANFIYVTSTVFLLIFSSWQLDHGIFDRPLMIGEYFIRLAWFLASIQYTTADVNRLTKDNTTNAEGRDSLAANRNAESDANYVEMGSAPPQKSWIGSSSGEKPVDRARTNPAWSVGSPSRSERALHEPVKLGRSQSDATRTREFFLREGEPVAVKHSAVPDAESSVDTTLDTFSTLLSSHEPGAEPTISIRQGSGRPPISRKGVTQDASLKTDTAYDVEPYCGMEVDPSNCAPLEPQNFTNLLADPAAGPQRMIPGRDIDSTATPPTPEPDKNLSWSWSAQTVQEAGAQMSSFMGGLLPQQNTGDQAFRTTQKQFSLASPTPTTETAPVTHSKGESPGSFGREKPKSKNKTKFWRDREIV